MLVGIDTKGNKVKILDSLPRKSYTCPICGEKLKRNFGVIKQYFSHRNGEGESCELKLKQKMLEEEAILSEENLRLLDTVYFSKKFDNIKTEITDEKSEEGYPLTKEQVKIIKSKEDKIKISATAGSSKTTTLYYYAKARPNKKILYLVYNAAMKKEAEESFGKLGNVTVKTVHGLAYQYVGKNYRDKLTFNYRPIDVLKDLNLSSKDKHQELAVNIYLLLNEFMLSDKETLEEIEMFTEKEYEKDKPKILKLANKLWEKKKSLTSSVNIEHDFYLKLFHLGKKQLTGSYDIVMLDEAQDSNLLTLDMVNNLNINGVVMVGDPYQQMYEWRNAQDILKLFEAKEYHLLTSFRVSQNIANIANLLISDILGERLEMKGFNSEQKIVHNLSSKDKYTCIARTNSYLFNEAIDLIYQNKRIYFEGGFNSYKFNEIKDAYSFSIGVKNDNAIFKRFKDYDEMKKFAKTTKDVSLLSLIAVVSKYGGEIPRMIRDIKNNCVEYKKSADVIMTTTHKSKGQTYQNVKICEDFASMKTLFKDLHIEEISPDKRTQLISENQEECRILYVAITRAKGKIMLSNDLKEYLILRHMYFNN